MSYVEHGPRIFLAGRPNTGIPLSYGDYVLPRKRLEGRLKLYDSCSDIRAWSPNSLENSRYFRELNEHASSIGKIIPFNVIIDNIIQLNSQAQNELQSIKKELQKYKSLKLTFEQEEQLQYLNDNKKIKESLQKYDCTVGSLLKVNISKSVPMIHTNSYLSIHIPSGKHFQNSKQYSSSTNQTNPLYSYSLTGFDIDSVSNNCNLLSPYTSTFKSFSNGDCSDKSSPCIEHADVALQVNAETSDIGIQFDGRVNKYLNKTITASEVTQTSVSYKSSDEASSIIKPDKSSSQTNNCEEQSFECDASYSQTTQDILTLLELDSDTGTESDIDTRNSINKRIIIQKDSEIIVLENQLCVKDVELEELQDMNKKLEISLKQKQECVNTLQENLKILYEKLMKIDHQRNYEVEDFKKKLYSCKYLIGQLKQDLNKKCESCNLQAQEIEKLRLRVTEVTALQLEKASLIQRLQEMEDSCKKAESCDLALEQLRNIMHEKDELKKQNHEQSCILADQETEINRLLILIRETSVTYEEQTKMKNMLENLKIELQDKNINISHYEDQLQSMKREIGDFFTNLKHVLNNLEEFNGSCEDICNCKTCDLDIGEEANNVLYNINIMMTRFQSYKIQHQNFLQQIEDLKDCINNDKQPVYLNQDLRNAISEDFYYESEIDPMHTSGKNSVIVLSIGENKNSTSELEFENVSNSVNSEHSLNKTTNHSYEFKNDRQKCIITLNRKDTIGKIEKEIIEYITHFLGKMHYLIQKLQVYVEIERPFMIKQICNFYNVLKNTEAAINDSEDITLKKQRISKIYNQHKEEHKKYEPYIKQLPNDLSQMQIKINEFIEAILCQLLHEVLCAEKRNLYDKQINQAFEKHFRSCIDRINTALQGAGDQCTQIVEEIEKQQKELHKKGEEIAELKKEVEQHLVQRGEGDCLRQEESKRRAAVEEELSKVTADLSTKNIIITELEERLQITANKLSVYDKECNTLRKEKKNLENVQNRLRKECQQNKEELKVKSIEIKNLSQQLHDIHEINNLKNIMDNKIKEMEKELVNIQCENNELKCKIKQTTEIISKQNGSIMDLRNTISKNENVLIHKITNYKNAMEGKQCEIIKLQDENNLLSEKLKDVENKLAVMNKTILSLTEQNDKIDIIYVLQEDLAKLDKNEKKLKIGLNNLKVQLANDQNNNKKLDNNLDMFLRENENLKKTVEYWKNENSELSMKLCNEMVEGQLKNKLCNLSNKICDHLLVLKKRHVLDKDLSNDQSNEKLQDKYKICLNEKGELPRDNMNKDMNSKFENERREIKENEVEEIEKEQIINDMRHLMEHLKNENKENEDETKNLLYEIETRDSEIRNLKETINRLRQENVDLHTILKSQIEEYQDKLILMKKNYNSSLNALSERHKEGVETLQKRFEDTINGERIFDSENWLQSLKIKELTDLYQRISTIINSKSDLIHMKDENSCFYEANAGKDLNEDVNKIENESQSSKNNIYKTEQMSNVLGSSILEEQHNSHVQHQWPFMTSIQTQNYPALQTQNYKLNMKQNYGCLAGDRKPLDLGNEHEKEKHAVKDNALDQQRWNFVNQCTAYHKLSNIYEYSRLNHAD